LRFSAPNCCIGGSDCGIAHNDDGLLSKATFGSDLEGGTAHKEGFALVGETTSGSDFGGTAHNELDGEGVLLFVVGRGESDFVGGTAHSEVDGDGEGAWSDFAGATAHRDGFAFTGDVTSVFGGGTAHREGEGFSFSDVDVEGATAQSDEEETIFGFVWGGIAHSDCDFCILLFSSTVWCWFF
jgi:hypothetical protein